MKKSVLITLILFSVFNALSQNGEFQTYDNGLIYSDVTIKQLTQIVEELDLNFSTSALNKTYYSKQQALGHFVRVSVEQVKEAKKDIENNISYGDFLNKYPNAEIDDNLLIIKFQFKDYKDNEIVEFSSLKLGNSNEHIISFENQTELYSKKLHHSWVFEYSEGSKYSSESIRAFYFIEEFKSTPIPEKYANYIHYSDYFIDTTTQIYFKNARHDALYSSTEKSENIRAFLQYFYEKTNRPDSRNFEEIEDYWVEYQKWDSLKIQLIDKKTARSKKFKKLLKKAYQEAISKGGSSDEFETIVGAFLSKEKELYLRRNRIVVGECGMDSSPRKHAFRIAVLAAETLNWKLFLRAHLDIMNDNFTRISDGSYAWGGRQTYIKELEEIKLKIPNLFLGISLRIENPCTNHYYGDVGRVGRALAESKYPDELEKEMLDAIADNELDDYNRLMIYYLFLNYNYHIQDEERQENNLIRLQKAVNELPEYLSIRIQNDNYQFERLLRNELNLIHQHFTISNSFFGSIISTNWEGTDGDCWNATLKDKNEELNISFYVTMKYDSKPGSIQPLIEQKDSLLERVHKVSFLMNLLKEDPNKKLSIHFTVNKSFSNKAQKDFLRDLTESGKENLNYQLDDAILLSLSNEYNNNSYWLLFSNGDIMLWEFGGRSPLEQYTKEQLTIPSSDLFYNDTSFKIFDENGNLKE